MRQNKKNSSDSKEVVLIASNDIATLLNIADTRMSTDKYSSARQRVIIDRLSPTSADSRHINDIAFRHQLA